MSELERRLEPEVMDTVDEAIAYDEMDHAEVNRRFVDDLLAVGEIAGDVLDLGTGTALIPIELCRRMESIRVLAVDLSASMLDLARNNIEVANLSQRIRLDRVDAKQLHFADGQFATVISNSIIHHIPDPVRAIGEGIRVTRGGGLLFFRDLLRPGTASELDGLVQTYAGSESDQARQLFRDSLHAALTLDEMRDIVRPYGFSADTVQASSDRHWTWIAHRPLGTRS